MIAVRCGIVFLAILFGVKGTEKDPQWAKKLQEVLQARDESVPVFEKLKREGNAAQAEKLISILEQLPSHLEGIDKLNVSAIEEDRSLLGDLKKLLDEPEIPVVSKFFKSKSLQTNYRERGLGFILRTLRAHYDYRCIATLLSPSQGPPESVAIPIETMCSRVKEDLDKQDAYTFSTDKICKNVKLCSGSETPHPYGDSDGTNVQDACVDDNKCDVATAIPMMGALLWYKVSTFIARSFCSNSLSRPDKSSLEADLKEIDRMGQLILAYSSTLYWDDFFRKAVEVRAFSSLPDAMALVEERKNAMSYVSLTCIDLQAEDMCTVGSISKLFQSLKKLKLDRDNPPATRNLRLYSRIDNQEMIKLQTQTLQHIELLGNIRNLDENLQTAVEGISGYFKGLAEYDQGIAQADVTFLKDKLKEFDTRAGTLSEKLDGDVKGAMIALVTAQALQVIEESTILGLKIAEHANVLKVIFGGLEAGDIYEQTTEVARAIAEAARGIALMVNLASVYDDLSALDKDFIDNADQIANLYDMVEAIKKNKIEDIGFDADRFIKGYGDYTPKVSKARLAQNDALWAAFKDSTCDLLFSAQGIGAAATQGVVGGMLLCEKLEGTLAEFAALRENIFDFQFDLVDALARVVRGEVAKKLSESITVSNDLLSASQLMLGFFMAQYRLQSHAALYCDKLEYLNQGKKIGECTSTGFFTKHTLDTLIAYEPISTFHEVERFVYIPTRPENDFDTGFINLPSLAKGNSVTFRIPARRSWLLRYNWLASGENLAPFVQSFKVYLPLKEYKTGSDKEHSVTRIELRSVAGSSFSETGEVVYNVPFADSIYVTTYNEGFDRCPNGKEISNPYSLCNNLPAVCDTSTRVTPDPATLMPTVLSTWKLNFTKNSGEQILTWNAPNPATNLLIIGKVKLRFLPQVKKRRIIGRLRDEAPDGCCSGNTYRSEWRNRACASCPSPTSCPSPNPNSCPTKSVINLRGYYCEKGNEDVAKEPSSS